jgi:S1-C subfamily serine protease
MRTRIHATLETTRATGISRRQFARVIIAGVPFLALPVRATQTRRLSALPDFVELIERVAPSIVAVGDGKQTVGSGFAVAPDLVVTAAHVATAIGADAVVTSSAGRQPARIVGTQQDDDIALLEIGKPLPVLPLAAQPSKVGEWIVVIGNPFGAGMVATVGIVSAAPGAITATAELSRRLQINASVNPGNSGGPVVNLAGEVVGATTSLVAGGQGIAFATSAAALRSFLAAPRK